MNKHSETRYYMWIRKSRVNLFLLLVIITTGTTQLGALHNDYFLHDPSSIIKCDDTYWIFATGNGIHALYSKDLVGWTNGQSPFPFGYFPSWIENYVPDFGGHFWAPECFYMNGQYYLYYSCSSWGSRNSCIGLLTATSLNPGSPDYGWTDKGMVVYSTDAGNVNCIDPAVFRDDEGRIWLSYGSHWDGIRIIELDSITGKVIGGTHFPVAGKGDYKTEASYVINHGNYYYLFFNRGQCCEGVNSTYYIQVGRSASPTGPFLDKNGKNCYDGGGTTVLSTSGAIIGPGCLGYYAENGYEYATYHYYDGTNSGVATLNIGTVHWDENDWPVFTNNWIEDGDYSIRNVNSRLVWDISGTGQENDPVIQSAYSGTSHQKWSLEAIAHDGYYYISPAGNSLVVMLKDCFGAPGTLLELGILENKSCQMWKIEKAGGKSYMLTSKYGDRVLEVPGSSMDEGTELVIDLYYSGPDQEWEIADTFINVAVLSDWIKQDVVKIYPNPSAGEQVSIVCDPEVIRGEFELVIFTLEGKIVFSERYRSPGGITVPENLKPQLYFVSIIFEEVKFFSKLVVTNTYY
ncbi:MAG: family 43 glycosylhydrolase [Bacteroidales bacterium]|nr:family 43 glycosylhydrolase [Bacteroidales bacterium]